MNQPDLITFSIFGSQNLSRNQSHQTRRSEYFFNLWQPKPVKKESKSPNQKIRIIELKWFESARFDYFFNLWQPKPVQKESKSPNQKIRIIELKWSSESARLWLLLDRSLAAKDLSRRNQSLAKPEDHFNSIILIFWFGDFDSFWTGFGKAKDLKK